MDLAAALLFDAVFLAVVFGLVLAALFFAAGLAALAIVHYLLLNQGLGRTTGERFTHTPGVMPHYLSPGIPCTACRVTIARACHIPFRLCCRLYQRLLRRFTNIHCHPSNTLHISNS